MYIVPSPITYSQELRISRRFSSNKTSSKAMIVIKDQINAKTIIFEIELESWSSLPCQGSITHFLILQAKINMSHDSYHTTEGSEGFKIITNTIPACFSYLYKRPQVRSDIFFIITFLNERNAKRVYAWLLFHVVAEPFSASSWMPRWVDYAATQYSATLPTKHRQPQTDEA